MNILASCAFSLESPVKWELQRLGLSGRVIQPGQIRFEGTWRDVARCNLWLRVADRLQIEIAEFEAADFEALFENIRSLDWAEWMPVEARFPVNARSRHSALTSVPAIQRSSKRAIVEALYRGHSTKELPETGPEYRIEVMLVDDRARICLDTTGSSLHKRGYRTRHAAAPIKETLAAALIELSVWNPERPLIDPFCGSGTIPIEAALIGLNIAPGLRRSFICEDWPQSSAEMWSDLRAEAQRAIASDRSLQIIGTDHDPGVLRLARRNAEQAGVADQIHWQQKSFEQLRSKREYGCIITNPPYGERLDLQRDLQPLYESIPQVLQRLPTWSHFILTSVKNFERIVQRKATRRRKLFNGRIECHYYQFLGPRPPRPEEMDREAQSVDGVPDSKQPLDRDRQRASSTDASPVFGGLAARDRQQAELLANRLRKRARHFRRWPTRRGIHCYRLYDRDIPELPFTIEVYEDHVHMVEFERPHDRDLGHHAAWLELMKKTVAAELEIPISHVHLKTRQRQRGSSQHEKQSDHGRLLTVRESDLKFLVNLDDYADTGLFLDHRLTRQMVREEAEGKRFLNLFAYTGSFTVYAAAGGAGRTCTVDWSRSYLDWARQNMQLNGFSDARHRYVKQSAVDFVDQLDQRESETFDLVVVDPPTFSNSKRTEAVWDVQQDYARLLQRLARHVTPGGIVYFSTNFRRFRIDENELDSYQVIPLSRQTVPEDFRNRRIHQCWKLIRGEA